MGNKIGYVIDNTLLKMTKPDPEMRTGNWEWVYCEDGYCVFSIPYSNKSLTIKNEYIRKYMNQYIAKYKNRLPVFYWKKIKKGKKRIFINDINIITNGILSIAKAAKQKKLVEKAFIPRGRSLVVRRIAQPIANDGELQWEDIRFYDGYFIFRPKLEGSLVYRNIEPLKVVNFRCKKSFNFIIKYFKARLPKITFEITSDNKIKLCDQPAFETVLVDLAKEQMRQDKSVKINHVAGTVYRLGFSEAISKGREMSLEDFKKYKSQFIDFLVDHQTEKHKMVPITESISHRGIIHNEEGFIFTSKSSIGFLLIIVENVNRDRSTMIFKVSEWNYRVALHTIFDYVQSDAVNKRSAIRDQKIDFSEAGVREYWALNHDSFHDWKCRLLQYLR